MANNNSHFDDILERASGVPVNRPEQQNRTADQRGSLEPGETVPLRQAVGPVISLEKSDIMFWASIGQLVLLYLIWRKL